MKTCSHCKQELPLEAFNNNSVGKLGKRAECRECVKRFTRSKHGLALSMYANQKESCVFRGYALPSYSAEELETWLLTQPEFHTLYDQWVLADYSKICRPSVDRINDYISYHLDNIQITTWHGNNEKNYESRMDGSNNKQSNAVDKLTIDGEFIERFYSVSEAARQFNGIPSNIIGAITNRVTRVKRPDGTYRQKTASIAYGHRWRYSTVPNNNQEILI